MRKKKEETFLEFNGTVSIVTRKNGRVKREPIDGNTVLGCVLHVLKHSLNEERWYGDWGDKELVRHQHRLMKKR